MMRIISATAVLFAFTGLACESGEAPDPKKKFLTAAKCMSDDDCGEGFVCNAADGKMAKGAEGSCQKGERSAAQKAAIEKAKAAEAAKKAAAKTATKPGEGRMTVRICPGFDNTPASIGTITATHRKTRKEHLIHLAMAVPDNEMQSNFTFYSLPLGTYDVKATYGVQVKGQPDVITLGCHEERKKDKEGCPDEKTRVIEVVLPKDEPKPELDKDGKPKKRPCDWIAE